MNRHIHLYDIAWAAGFFDGEGSVFFRGIKRKELNLTVSQSDRRPLDRFCLIIGIGAVRGPYKPRGNGKPYFVYSVNSYIRVQAVVAMLWRFLSEPKREQAYAALMEARPYYLKRSVFGKGRAILTLAQSAALRDEHLALRIGRQRVPKGSIQTLMQKYGITSESTLNTIVGGRGYQKGREVADVSV